MKLHGVTALIGTLGVAVPLQAAPVVSSPFFLAHPAAETTDYSLAGTATAFVLVWSASASTYAQWYQADGSMTTGPMVLDSAGGSRTWSRTSGARVASNDTAFLASWTDATYTLTPPSTVPLPLSSLTRGAILSSAADVTRAFLAPLGFPYSVAKLARAGQGWVAMTFSRDYSLNSEFAVRRLDAVGAWTAQIDLPVDFATSIFPRLGAVAAEGDTILAAWRGASDLRVVLIDGANAVNELTGSVLPTTADQVVFASNGESYLAVWQTSQGALAGARITVDGTVAPVAIDAVAAEASTSSLTPLDIEPAGGTYLVLYQDARAEGDTLVRGIRIEATGNVLDPGGFDVAHASGGDVAGAGNEVWLVATAEQVNAEALIRGRFVGATAVPTVPNNVELPVVDAGTLPPVRRPDAGNQLDAGALASDAGNPDSSSSGPDASKGSAADASDSSAPPVSLTTKRESGGCSCTMSRSRPGWKTEWVLLGALPLLGRRPKTGKGMRERRCPDLPWRRGNPRGRSSYCRTLG